MTVMSEVQVKKLTLEETANDGSDVTNPPADHRRLFLGEDGDLHLKDSAGAVTTPNSGGSGVTQSTVGTTSLGGSFDTTMKTVYKKITLATAGFLASIAVGVKGQASGGLSLDVAVMSDNAGTPLNIIAVGGMSSTRTVGGVHSEAVRLNSTARFITMPVGVWLTAADYWLCVVANSATGNDVQLAYTGSGSDRTKASTDGIYDHSAGASSAGTDNYSIYANILR